MKKESLRVGVISEKVLVLTFGTEKQITSYKSKNKFTGVGKNTILKAAAHFVDIEDLGNRKYKIISIHKYPLPSNISKMKKGIYRYIVPLMLNKIINDSEKYQNINFTTIAWARNIEMINGNYSPMRYHKADVASKLNFEKRYVYEFFDKVDIQIHYYMKQTFDYLKDTELICLKKVNVVCMADSGISKSSKNGKIKFNIDLKKIFRRATHEETTYIAECQKKAMEILEIPKKNNNECYYGKKSKEFMSIYSNLLLLQNILFTYDTYEISCCIENIDNLKFILSKFNVVDFDELVLSFNQEFQFSIIENCRNRYCKRNDTALDQVEKIPCIDCFKELSNITISKDAGKFKVIENNSVEEHNLVDNSVVDKISITVNGTELKIN